MPNSDAFPDNVDPGPQRTLWPWRRAALGVIALAAAGALLFLWVSEPRYKGKALRQWLGEFNRIPPDQPAPEAEEAIRAIGERALPFLLSSIWATEGNEISRARIWINQTFTRTYRSRIDLCAPSWRALSILGPRADAAIPEIVKHAADGPFEGRADRAGRLRDQFDSCFDFSLWALERRRSR